MFGFISRTAQASYLLYFGYILYNDEQAVSDIHKNQQTESLKLCLGFGKGCFELSNSLLNTFKLLAHIKSTRCKLGLFSPIHKGYKMVNSQINPTLTVQANSVQQLNMQFSQATNKLKLNININSGAGFH